MTGEHCCDEADGTYIEEDVREGHYWVRWSTVWQWQRVPDEVIIHGRVGLPVVWWHAALEMLGISSYNKCLRPNRAKNVAATQTDFAVRRRFFLSLRAGGYP
jgi:hypothetical protein